jgi:hypothetical protein
MEKIVIKYLQNDYTEEDIEKLNKWLSENDENKRIFFSSVAVLKSGHLKQYFDPAFVQEAKAKLQERIRKENAGK